MKILLAVPLLLLTVRAYGYAAVIEIKQLIAESDVVVVAEVLHVRSSPSRHSPGNIATANVLATWKGQAGSTIEYIASPADWFLCDITTARVGETVVLFLAKDTEGRLRIAHYGRGRMLLSGDERDRQVHAYEVTFPWITEPDGRPRLDAVIPLATLERLVKADRTTMSVSRKDPFVPPAGAESWCSGHVTGAPAANGSPGLHIIWTAYTSADSPETIAKRYNESLGSELHHRDNDCETWRNAADAPSSVVHVCKVGASGPWRDCGKIPAGHRTIIMISSIAR